MSKARARFSAYPRIEWGYSNLRVALQNNPAMPGAVRGILRGQLSHGYIVIPGLADGQYFFRSKMAGRAIIEREGDAGYLTVEEEKFLFEKLRKSTLADEIIEILGPHFDVPSSMDPHFLPVVI